MAQLVNLYSIYDVKAQNYGNIFSARTDGLAIRVFSQIISFSGNGDYARFPEDFALYRLGTFDDISGAVCADQHPTLISSAISVLQQARGAAVGGDSPLKQQRAGNADSADVVTDKKPACDVESESIPSKAEVKNA